MSKRAPEDCLHFTLLPGKSWKGSEMRQSRAEKNQEKEAKRTQLFMCPGCQSLVTTTQRRRMVGAVETAWLNQAFRVHGRRRKSPILHPSQVAGLVFLAAETGMEHLTCFLMTELDSVPSSLAWNNLFRPDFVTRLNREGKTICTHVHMLTQKATLTP